MGKLSDNKLAKLNALEPQGGFWYITKQNLIFRDLCFMAKILESWGDRKEESYQSFFDSHKGRKEFGSLPSLTAHRATKNCEYIGLTTPSSNYRAENLTPFYFALKDICKGDFDRLSSFPEIIDKQLERIFIDSSTSTIYNVNFQICPFMFLFKVLLLIGDITKSYKISKSEFKLFVATAQTWMEYFEVVESILRYREDSAYRTQCDINASKVSDVRYNILAENHSQIFVEGSDISIIETEIKNVRRKVSEYELSDSIQSSEDIFYTDINNNSSEDLPLQQIFYGAPGTGKSHETNRVTRKYRDTIRTTFHPDSDYSTFVGTYKPTTTEECVYGLNGDKTICLKDVFGNPLKTSKIEYKFIPQAFIKAYIQAWKKMTQMTITTHATTIKGPIILEGPVGSNLSWKITEIKGQDIYLESCFKLVKEDFKKSAKDLWDKAWKSGKYTQDVFTSFTRYEQTVCNWIDQNLGTNDFEGGWDRFIAELNNGTLKLQVNPFSDRKVKTFYYHIDGDNIIINATVSTSYDTVSDYYESETEPSNYKKAIANKLKDYHTNDFDEAWQKLEEELEQVDGSRYTIKVESQFLVIEEINRGNCAQIFGDLFQLLDRTKNGFSEYPIEADEDISKYIKEELKELAFNQEIIDYINQQFVDGDMNPQTYDLDGKRVHILDAILNGKILVLPANLYIWATMNTSDQSLFPIDSAFKRRWDWEYKPIVNHLEENWKIQIGGVDGVEYDWWTFLTKVNDIINELTSSEDKKLGYFFAKAKKEGDKKVVDLDTMVNKVFFYLWNDVFKDYDLGHVQDFPKTKDTSKTDSKERPYSFGDFFDKVKGEINEKAVADFMNQLLPTTDTPSSETAPQEESAQ